MTTMKVMMPLHAGVVERPPSVRPALGEHQRHERAEERHVDQREDRRRGVLDVAVDAAAQQPQHDHQGGDRGGGHQGGGAPEVGDDDHHHAAEHQRLLGQVDVLGQEALVQLPDRDHDGGGDDEHERGLPEEQRRRDRGEQDDGGGDRGRQVAAGAAVVLLGRRRGRREVGHVRRCGPGPQTSSSSASLFLSISSMASVCFLVIAVEPLLGAGDVVLADLAVLLELLEVLLGGTAQVAHRDPAVLGLGPGDLDVLLAALLGQLGEHAAQHLAVVGRVDAEVGVADGPLDVASSRPRRTARSG